MSHLYVFDQLAQANRRFKQQRQRARDRGIDWHFTFEQWLCMWIDSGFWHLRGKGSGKYVMSRNGDAGPYSPENCAICTFEKNIRDGGGRGIGSGKGWTLVGSAYQVMVRNKYIGRFRTVAEAEAAYADAISSH